VRSPAMPDGVCLGLWPTPMQEVIGAARTFVKREDLNGFAFGGTKVRALEALLNQARTTGSTTVVVGGRADSNWVALAAIAITRQGWECHCVFDASEIETLAVHIARSHGAVIHRASRSPRVANSDLTHLARGLGPSTFSIDRAGATAVGAYAYASLASEIRNQVPDEMSFDIVVPLGSGGLTAGLLIGLAEAAGEAGHRDISVVGVPVSKSGQQALDVVGDLVRACTMQGLTSVNVDGALGRLRLLRRSSARSARADYAERACGTLLDPVFAGPTWHTYCELDTSGERGVVLVASGGLPAVFDSASGVPS